MKDERRKRIEKLEGQAFAIFSNSMATLFFADICKKYPDPEAVGNMLLDGIEEGLMKIYDGPDSGKDLCREANKNFRRVVMQSLEKQIKQIG